jgi:hypothetical protein
MTNASATPRGRLGSAVMTGVLFVVVPLVLMLALAGTPSSAEADTVPVGQAVLDNYLGIQQTILSLGFQLREAIVSGNTTLIVNIRFQVTVTVSTLVASTANLPFSAAGTASELRF